MPRVPNAICGKRTDEKMRKMTITERQKRFVDYYIQLGNAEQAAIKAGYSPRYARGNAHKLVANGCTGEAIRARMGKIEDERIANGIEVLEYLTRVMRGKEKEIKKVIVNGAEAEIEEPPSVQQRTRAAELLGKRYGVFDAQKESDQGQLLQLIEGLVRDDV